MSKKNLKRRALKNDNLENVSGGASQDQKFNQTFNREGSIEYAKKIVNGEVVDPEISIEQAQEFLKKQEVLDQKA